MKEWKVTIGFVFVWAAIFGIIKIDLMPYSFLGAGIILAIMGLKEKD